MELNGALSNPQVLLEGLLEPVKRVKERLPLVAPAPVVLRRPLLRLGRVSRAVSEVLRRADTPMRAKDIHRACEAYLGESVSPHLIHRHGVRGPLASAFAIAAIGMAYLSDIGTHGSYLRDILLGMLIAGLGLGVAIVAVSVAILTGARPDETGMISGLNSTGHEIGGTLGIAIFTTFAAGAGGAIIGPHAVNGISHAFLADAGLVVLASLIALTTLPRASTFLHKLRLAPAMPMH